MRPKLSPPAGARVAGPRTLRAVPGERRGDLVGAQPRPGPRRSRRPAVQRVQVRARRLGQLRRAGGTGAFPSVATLVRYTGLSERTVRTCLDRLEAAGIMSPCDPGIVAARIKRADRRPQGWDLSLGMVRDDLAEADIVKLERQFPGLAARLAAMARPGPDDQTDGMRPPHPAPGNGEPVDDSPGEAQPAQPRGAAIAPEPPAAPARGTGHGHHSRRRRAGRRVSSPPSGTAGG